MVFGRPAVSQWPDDGSEDKSDVLSHTYLSPVAVSAALLQSLYVMGAQQADR